MKKRAFKIVLEPADGGWSVVAPEFRGCHTWGRSIGAARKNIREAIGCCVDALGEDCERIADEASLDEEVRLPVAVRRAIDEAYASRRLAEEQEAEARVKTTEAAKALTKKLGLSLRDAGDLLGLSHERVKQLAGTA